MGRKRNGAKPPGEPVWGAYVPDIMRSYPDMPVRGRIVDGKYGKEFRPDGDQPRPRHARNARLGDWLTDRNYDNLIQKMRETADQGIKELKTGIARLERFIDDN